MSHAALWLISLKKLRLSGMSAIARRAIARSVGQPAQPRRVLGTGAGRMNWPCATTGWSSQPHAKLRPSANRRRWKTSIGNSIGAIKKQTDLSTWPPAASFASHQDVLAASDRPAWARAIIAQSIGLAAGEGAGHAGALSQYLRHRPRPVARRSLRRPRQSDGQVPQAGSLDPRRHGHEVNFPNAAANICSRSSCAGTNSKAR